MLTKKLITTALFTVSTSIALMGCVSTQTHQSADHAVKDAPLSTENAAPTSSPTDAVDYPIHQVLRKIKNFEDIPTFKIRQEFNRSESPITQATVFVDQEFTGDDSVAAERSTYHFELQHGAWKEINKEDSWRCVRGKNTTKFQTQLCP
ncbi:hypothetical protein [Acinetobacter sp. MD2(2019)]|uniref:hypothetical protein n=1 Tax=Acinetobacter sp. MD2(2019) TaxID=2605273 RepID=UPI002D1F2DF8|nr:hypothetical protein [Acinetobacter sp. MD2(2019)]MEB3753074.1 hypothetical protein [Acinetobacter sp. MD2(2019)]